MIGKMIFGVPASDLEASRMATARQADESPQFLPESRLTPQEIHGAEWEPWRVSGDEQWYRRAGSSVEIHGEAGPEDIDFDDDSPERTTDEILSDFNREIQLIKDKYSRGELVGSDDDIDSDDFEDFDDE